MRVISILSVGLVGAIALAGPGHAAESSEHKGKRKGAYARSAAELRRPSERHRSDLERAWYPADSSVLPFGSRLWWDQKAREGGGTRD